MVAPDAGNALLVAVPRVAVKGRWRIAPIFAGLPRHFSEEPPHVLADESGSLLVVLAAALAT
jgi:hypothetical protein